MHPTVADPAALYAASLLERLEKVVWWTGFWQGAVTASIAILVLALFCYLLKK